MRRIATSALLLAISTVAWGATGASAGRVVNAVPPIAWLKIGGTGVANPMTLKTAELASLPQRSISVSIANGGQTQIHTESGPYLSDVLTLAGTQFATACKNDLLRYWIEVTSSNGTAAVLTRGEIDPGFGNRPAILSIAEDGRFLTTSGPRLIVPGDVTGGRDLQHVSAVTVGRATPQLPATGCADTGRLASAPSAGTVVVNGAVSNPLTLTSAQLQAMSQATQTVNFLSGSTPQTHTEVGPLLSDVLALAKPQFDKCDPNAKLRFYVEITSGSDGYASLLSWGDFDSAYGNRQSVVSLVEDGTQQTGGPRVTVPNDVKGGRYVSASSVITVFRAPTEMPLKGCS
jgi:hypothetical protein